MELGTLTHSNVLEKLETLNLKEFNEPLFLVLFSLELLTMNIMLN